MAEQPASPHPTSIQRPALPDGYGSVSTLDGTLSWAVVQAELETAHHYWLASVRPDGRPHVVPRWGVWWQGRFWYDGSPQTRHTRNVEANPAVTLNLESATRTVILEGTSVATRASADDLGARLSAAFVKYASSNYAPGPDSWSAADGGGLRVLTPLRVLAWFDFPKDCTRFRFD